MKTALIRFARYPGVGLFAFCTALILVTVAAFVMLCLVVTF